MSQISLPKPRISKYITDNIRLEPKPLLFLSLPHREALYGGAAGGMKTETLLAAALQYSDIPGYSAILFRRRLQEHKKPNCLIPRAKKWLSPWLATKEATWDGSEHKFVFKTKNFDGTEGEPSTLSFGYCYNVDTELQYQGAEYQFIGWDEGTQVNPDDYLYLFSRLRKVACPIHKTKMVWDEELNMDVASPVYVDGCLLCDQRSAIPLRVRTATNPGNRAHAFFKERFRIEKDASTGKFLGKNLERPYLPAYVQDNPHIDGKSYVQSLLELDPVRGRQLLDGDWDASPDSLYRQEYCNYYTTRSNYIVFDGQSHDIHNMRWFFTLDAASSDKDVLDGNSTAMGFWGLTQDYKLGLFDASIFQKEIPDVIDEAVKFYKKWATFPREAFVVEKNGLGVAIFQGLKARGLPVAEIWKSNSKIEFAKTGIIKMKQGRIYLPADSKKWKKQVEDQLFVWQGLPDEPDDIVDMFSMGCDYVDWGKYDSNLLENVSSQEESSVINHNPVQITSEVSYDLPNYFW